MEFRGWRLYSLRLEGGRMSLWGSRQEWESPVLTATCATGPISECPMETGQEWRERGGTAGWNGVEKPRWHGCGIHSFKTLEALLDEFGSVLAREVVAEVVNYGRVDEFEHGYRAEHTRILKMYLIAGKDSQADFMEALRRILETRFGVPVVVTSLANLIAEHAPDYRERVQNEEDAYHASIVQSMNPLIVGAFTRTMSLNGGTTWQTLVSASSATTTSPNRSQRRSGNPSPSSNPSPSNGKGVTKKKPVAANMPKNQKKWWLNR